MTLMRRDLPSGTVTFLFTDVEGSTKLLHELGAEAYAEALAEHRRILREAFGAYGGVEVDTQGDAFLVAFPTAPGALAAAAQALEGLSPGPIRVRMGIHTGTPHLAEEGYVGADVHRAARIAACGHGGQVLVSAATAHLLEPSNNLLLVDLGQHRLKDLSAPERISQLGDKEFPPLTSLHQTNLPIPATPFLGREQELSEVLGLLSQEHVRLLTLTGPGGTGKTRLGLQAAAGAAERYPHGVWWVPLAPLREPQLVLETAGQALGAKDGLAEHIGDKALLLLFDNFEHVVEAAAGLPELLAACPNLHLLVTSRELLHVPGEQAYPVPPLEPAEGTEFFLARARAALPSFVPSGAVPELCDRLEHLPLALELAAARVRVLSPEQLLERLSRRLDLLKGGRAVDPRQQTLRATIEWSYELLEPEEQRLFARLAVFRGGCTLETAEAVCEADLDTLQSLVDKSLLRHREERFWMLETIREFAAERFEESGEAEELWRCHAEHFLALAEDAEPHLGGNPKEWLGRLEREHDNLRAALDRLEASGKSQLALRLAGSLSRFWYLRGHLAEGRRRLEGALRNDERPTAARAKALNGAAMMALEGGDPATGRLRAEEALALHRKLGDAWGAAFCRHLLGGAFAEEGDFARARQIFAESVRAFRELGDEHFTLMASRALAWAYEELGDFERSKALHEENLRRARALGNERMEARSLGSLGAIAGDREGRVQDALSMLKEAYRIDRDHGDRLEIALDLCRFAAALAVAGRAGTATRLLSRSEGLREEIGVTFRAWGAEMNDRTLASIRAQLDEAAFAEEWEQGRALTVDEAVALALAEAD
jgi:predicted ATPase/class 3 adenylate cyclase